MHTNNHDNGGSGAATTPTHVPIWVGALAGLVAALAMTLMMLALRLLLGIAPPAELIPDRIAPTMSIEQFFALIDIFGGYNELKQLGVGSFLIGQLVLGIGLGAWYARVASRARHGAADAGPRSGLAGAVRRPDILFPLLVVLVAWVATLVVAWPVLASNFRGLPTGPARVATMLGLLASYATFGGVLVLAFRAMTRGASRAEDRREAVRVEAGGIGRRAALVSGVGAVLAVTSGIVLKRMYDLATFAYDGSRFFGPLTPVTPTELFYVVTKNVIDPNVDRGLWRFDVGGLVERPRAYTFDDVRALPATTQQTTLMCISNGVGDTLMSNAEWTGVPLRTLIEPAAPRPGVVEVVLHGVDGYTDTFSFEKAMDPTTLVVYDMNGQPLTQNHGYPVRVIVPGLFGEKNVKWVTRVELVDRDVKGFYETQGWGPDFAIPTRSRVFEPTFDEPIRVGTDVTLRGIVFAGDRGISSAEVSVDDGQSWQPAELEYPGTRLTWAIWRLQWRPGAAGEYRLVVRGTDASGAPQPSEDRGIVPSGGRGYHRVVARVVA